MADWENNDSGGMDEEQAIKKMIKIVESFNKTMKGGIDLTEKSQVQLMKSILSHQKAYKTDKDHQMWKQQDREVAKRNAIEIFQERQKELRLTRLINRSLQNQKSTYDSVFKSLSGSRGIVQSLKMLTGRFTEIKTAIAKLAELDKERDENKGDAGKLAAIKTAREDAQKTLNILTLNNDRLKMIGRKLSSLGEFMEKHAGKLIIGAAAISILTGIITKALNVAPLFQAMMKLMQFAVTMILMPIGTFIGAVIRPIVIGLVKSIAPQFGDWMKNSMALGASLGNWLTGLVDNEFFKKLGMAVDRLSVGGDWVQTMEDNPAITLGAVGASVAAAIVISKKVLPRLVPDFMKTGGGGTNGKISTTYASNNIDGKGSKFMVKDPPKGSTQKGILNKLKLLLERTGKGLEKGLKGKGKLGGGAIPILLMELLLPMDDILKAKNQWLRDVTGQNDNHNQLFADGYSTTGAGLGTRNQNWKADGGTSPFSHNTPDLASVNSMMLTLGAPAQWMQDEGILQKLTEILGGGEISTLENSFATAAKMGEMFEEVMTEMATVDGITMTVDMKMMVEHFKRLRGFGLDAEAAAQQTADTFSRGNIAITNKLAGLLAASKVDVNSPQARAERRATAAQAAETAARLKTARETAAATVSRGGGHTGFGGNGFDWTTDTPVKIPDRHYVDKISGIPYVVKDGVTGFDYENATDRSGNNVTHTNEDANQKVRDEIEKELAKARAPWEDNSSGGVNDRTPAQILSDLTGGLLGGVAAANGFSGMVKKPTMFLAGEAGAEHVQVTPNGGGSGGGITINIGKIERTADFNQLKPMIQRWILESNSRRGMI